MTMRLGEGRLKRVLVGGALLAVGCIAPAAAQTPPDPNPGGMTLAVNVDVPTLYVFRGIVQEGDPKLTAFPSADLGIALGGGDGAVKSVGLNLGTWHSLNGGSSGSDGGSGKMHYEEDFYATFGLGFGAGVSLGATFTAYTSPNQSFGTVKELSFKLAKANLLNPYGVVAFELSGAADGVDEGTGTYLELGVGPAVPLGGGKATLTVPVKIGLSLSDYYQGADGDEKFGYLDIGGLITVPLTGVDSRFGSWNLHGGVDVFVFGDTTKAFNAGDKAKVVGLVGLGFVY